MNRNISVEYVKFKGNKKGKLFLIFLPKSDKDIVLYNERKIRL